MRESERERAVKENKDPEVGSLQNSTILINLSSRNKSKKKEASHYSNQKL